MDWGASILSDQTLAGGRRGEDCFCDATEEREVSKTEGVEVEHNKTEMR